MATGRFMISSPPQANATVGVEPVYNVLNSLALLNSVERLPALDAWVVATAAALTPEQRHANRLALEGLGDALLPERDDWPDFPAYLEDLVEQRPETLRDRLLRRLTWPPRQGLVPANESPVDPAVLLSDLQAYLAYLEQVHPGEELDRELQEEIHRLLNNPPALHDLIVSHLRTMWETYLETEWRKALPGVQGAVNALRQYIANGAPVLENLRSLIGRDVAEPEDLEAGRLQEIIFVPSPHTARYVTRLYSGGRVRVFFSAHRSFGYVMRGTPVGRTELVGRLEALADETRLRILELFAGHDELTAQEIMSELNLTQSSASRSLKQLNGYLSEQRKGGATKSYRFNPASIDFVFRALKRLLSGDELSSEALAHASAAYPLEIRRFLDRQGRVLGWPAKEKDKLRVLEYLATRFEPGRDYTEKEVNAVIAEHLHPFFKDFVTIRRALYDYQFLNRERDGSRYWRAEQVAARPNNNPAPESVEQE
jgi:hypothetical protein